MAFNIPTYEIHVRPKHYNSADGAASGYRAAWLKHVSNTTSSTSNGGREILTPASPRTGIKSWEWWSAWEFYVDTSWDPALQGQWGTIHNWHNAAIDVGGPCGPIGWSWPSNHGTSAVQHGYIGGNLYQQINAVPGVPGNILAVASLPKGQWHSILNQVIFGRTDGTVSASGHPNGGQGRFRTWINGSNTPIDSGNTNTIRRATCSADQIAYTQTAVWFWDGFYTANTVGRPMTQDCVSRLVAARFGRTLAECLADNTVTLDRTELSTILDPNDPAPNLGPTSYTVLTSRTDSDFLVPSSLGGSGAPSGLDHDGPWTTAVQWNATSPDPEDPPPTVTEQHIGPWSTVVGWNAAGGLVSPDDSTLTITAHNEGSLTTTAHTKGTLTLTPQ